MDNKKTLEKIQMEDRDGRVEGFIPLGLPYMITICMREIPEMNAYYQRLNAEPQEECDVRDLFGESWTRETKNIIQTFAPGESEAYALGPDRLAKIRLTSYLNFEWAILTPIQFYKRLK